MKYIYYFIVISLLFFQCSKKDNSLKGRLMEYKSLFKIQNDNLLIISMDDCSSCSSYYKEQAKNFQESGGAVIVVSKFKKKANGFLNLKTKNTFHDSLHFSKKLNLEAGLPVIYHIHKSGKIDSLRLK